MTALEKIRQALIEGRDLEVGQLVKEALEAGASPPALSRDGLIAAMDVVGERFRKREVFLPEVLLAARAMHAGLEILRPHLEGEAATDRGTVVMGTVEGDIHDIGKNLVSILLRGAGCRVIDLGKGVTADAFVEAVEAHQAEVVGASALLTTTMPAMSRVVRAIREAGHRTTKIMIGGAPVTAEFAREIEADGYGADGSGAVDLVREWLP